uniref:Uncharacterized protein n=1 Tax=Sparus aurata TaxID=8175 RepID=A0A671YYL5_SPAAU
KKRGRGEREREGDRLEIEKKDRKSHSRSCGLQSGGCGAGSLLCRSGCVQSASGFPRRLAPPHNADPATSLAGGEGKNVCQTLEETDPREGDSVREDDVDVTLLYASKI